MPSDSLINSLQRLAGVDSNNIRPLFFDLRHSAERRILQKLIVQKKIDRIIDTFDEQVEEYKLVTNPRQLTEALMHKEVIKRGSFDIRSGVWIYYPWRSTVVHCLDKNKFRTVRLSRNHNLISKKDQKKLATVRVGIAGLNVGNPAAVCLNQVGVGTYFKLADNDVLSLSNFNRFRASLTDLGINKAVLTARQLYEIDPFVKLDVLPQGILAGKEHLFVSRPAIDILVEEVDNLPLKISLRKAAREARVPVVMVTGNGPNVLIDVERYDQKKNLPILNGKLSLKVQNKVGLKSPLRERVLLARDFVGMRYLVQELRDSFLEVGVSLAGIPQLAEASFLRGAVLCYFVRQISLGGHVPSGRYALRMDTIIKQ